MVEADSARAGDAREARDYLSQARALRQAGELERADALLRHAVEQLPANPAIWTAYAVSATHGGDPAAALPRWEAMRARLPDQPDGYALGAYALRMAGQSEAAEALAASGMRRFAGDERMHFEHAAAAAGRKDWPEAERRWRGCIEAFADTAASYIGLTGVLKETGRFAEAEQILQRAIARLPNTAALVVDYARVARRKGDLPTALRRWRASLAAFPGNVDSEGGLAQALFDSGRLDEAEAVLEVASARVLQQNILAFVWCQVAIARRQWPEALARWMAYCKRFPEEPRYDAKLPAGILEPCRRAAGGLAGAAARLAEQIKGAPGWENVAQCAAYLLGETSTLPEMSLQPADAEYLPILQTMRAVVDWKTCRLRPDAARRQLVASLAARRQGKTPWSPIVLLVHLALSCIRPSREAAVVVTMRNEGISILEWVAHYRALGFSGIFVYANGNTDGSDEMLRALCTAGVVTCIDNEVGSGVQPQRKAYEHSLRGLPELRDYEWACYVDADELLVLGPRFGDSITEVLKQVAGRYSLRPPSAICYTWRWYGSGYAPARTPGLMLERFQHTRPVRLFKSMVRIADVLTMHEVHYPDVAREAFFVDAALNVIPESTGPVKYDIWKYSNDDFTAGQLNHYWCKSFEEFLIKRQRGDGIVLPGAKYAISAQEIDLFFSRNAAAEAANHAPPPAGFVAAVKAELARLRGLPGTAAAEAAIESHYRKLVASLGKPRDVRAMYEAGAARNSVPLAGAAAAPPVPVTPPAARPARPAIGESHAAASGEGTRQQYSDRKFRLETSLRAEPGNREALEEYFRLLFGLAESNFGLLHAYLPGLDFPLYFRGNTPDIRNMKRVFFGREHGFDFVSEPQRILHLGANCGYLSVYLANRFPAAGVCSVEPDGETFAVLTMNTAPYRQIRRIHRAHSCTVSEVLAASGWTSADFVKCDLGGAELEVFSDPDAAAWIREAICISVRTHDRLKPGGTAAVEAAIPTDLFARGKSGEYSVFTRKASSRPAQNPAGSRPERILLATGSRRPISFELVNVRKPNWFQTIDDETLQLHPNQPGDGPAELRFTLRLSGQREFRATCHLAGGGNQSVIFSARLDGRGGEAGRAEIQVAPGASEPLTLDLSGVSGPFGLTLGTEMAPGAVNNGLSWARWVCPTLQ